LTRKDPLPTPFAALANGSTSFKSTDSETPEAVRVVSQEPPPDSDAAKDADEPSTTAVVLDIISQLFTAKSAEPETKQKEEKKEEEESAPVALYFPYSNNGPPPPPPIPAEFSDCSVSQPSPEDVNTYKPRRMCIHRRNKL
jgi:hypothetical protein